MIRAQREKAILRQIYNSGACGTAFEGGEPLLRNDLVEILARAIFIFKLI